MTPERKVSPAPRRPHEVYGFTEQERLFWRISQERFDALLNDDLTAIHDIVETSNNYGEFVFVTTSRSAEQGRVAMSFYGLGYHEYRERWIHNEWFWYQANIRPNMMDLQLAKDVAYSGTSGYLATRSSPNGKARRSLSNTVSDASGVSP